MCVSLHLGIIISAKSCSLQERADKEGRKGREEREGGKGERKGGGGE